MFFYVTQNFLKNIYLFIYFFKQQSYKEEGREIHREIFHVLVHSPHGLIAIAGLVQSKEPGASSCVYVLKDGASSAALSGTLTGSWIRGGAVRISTSAYLRRMPVPQAAALSSMALLQPSRYNVLLILLLSIKIIQLNENLKHIHLQKEQIYIILVNFSKDLKFGLQ